MENKEPAPGGLSPRALRHAVREYLANDLSVDKAYIDRVIASVVSARNIDGIVQTELQKYFHKGPDGFKAGEIVGERVAAAVDRQVDTMMKNGVRDALRAAVDGHVRQMTDGPARDRLETICSGRNCAVYLSTETVVATFRASLHYALDWAEPCEQGLMWGLRAKPSTTYASWLADDIIQTFELGRAALRVDGHTVRVPPDAMEKIIKKLFPWLGDYDRSFRFAEGVLFVYGGDETKPGPGTTTKSAETGRDSDDDRALLAKIREIAKNPVAFDTWPEDARELYMLARACTHTKNPEERTETEHA